MGIADMKQEPESPLTADECTLIEGMIWIAFGIGWFLASLAGLII